MTKAEELKLLEKIEELLRTSDANSYIASMFAGVTEVCRNNIINDFGDEPVRDLSELRERFDAEVHMHDVTKYQLAEAQKALKEAIDNAEVMQNRITELEEQRDAMSDCVDGIHAIIDQAEAEIRKLKAEIVRMRVERMTDDEMATMYDRMNEED